MGALNTDPESCPACRERLEARGLRQLADEIRRQLALAEGSEAERQALEFIAGAADWSEWFHSD